MNYLIFNNLIILVTLTVSAILKLGYQIMSLIGKSYHVASFYTVKTGNHVVVVFLLLSLILVCNCYISPNSGDSNLDTLLTFLISNHDRVIITGDFNLPDIKWYFLTGNFSSSNSFCNFVFDNNLVQLVDSPTHVGGNVLDIVLTTDDQLIEGQCVCNPNQSFCSDHLMITFNYSHRSSQPNFQYFLMVTALISLFLSSQGGYGGCPFLLLDYGLQCLFSVK